MSEDTTTASAFTGTKTRRGPRTPAAAVRTGRPGRPAAPQTFDEAITAYRTKLQAARKAIHDASGLLLRLSDLEGGTGGTNWHTHIEVRTRLNGIDYDLQAAQLTVAPGGALTSPTDKLA